MAPLSGCRGGPMRGLLCGLRRSLLAPPAPVPSRNAKRAQHHPGLRGLRIGQPTPWTHPHLLQPRDLTPGTTAAEYAARRTRVVEALPSGSVLVLPSHPKMFMTHDIPWAFRQESNFHFLSGLQDPDCVLLLARPIAGPSWYCLVVPEADEEHELWHGPRTDTATAMAFFGSDTALPTSALSTAIQDALHIAGQSDPRVFFMANVNPSLERVVLEALTKHQIKSYIPAGPLMQQVRRYKSPEDIVMFQRAADISAAAFRQALRTTCPGLSEYHIFNVMEFEARLRGAERLAYPPVVAGGTNGLALHYINNQQVLQDGDLLLVDAGAEYHYYTSDVTRTWPVSGRFSAAQKVVYEAVLDVNQQIIAAHSGNRLSKPAIHSLSVQLLTAKLIDLGVLRGTVEANVTRHAHVPFYPHAIGHPMGWDIHEEECHTLQPNMIVTVEPGLYLPVSDAVPKEFRGIAVRVEDNILLTQDTPIVLTRNIPKSVTEIEAVMKEGVTDPVAQYIRANQQS